MEVRLLTFASLTLSLVLLAACSSREDARGTLDSGPGTSDGGATDSGSLDSGSADAGDTDAGSATDAGTDTDAGSDTDAGTDPDAGTDAGPAPVDAGPGGCTMGTCPTGQYCQTEDGMCDAVGTCMTIPDGFCTTEYDPVCGCDGATYSNRCNAEHAGVSIYDEGECGASS